MRTATACLWGNPLVQRDLAHWRRRRGLAAGGFFLLASMLCLSLAGAQPSLPRPYSAFWSPLQLLALTIEVLGVVTPLVFPVLAPAQVHALKSSGNWDLIRLTTMSNARLADGTLARIFLRQPMWLVAAPIASLPLLRTLQAVLSGAWHRVPATLLLMIATALLQAAFFPAMLFSNTEFGLAMGLQFHAREVALGAVFVFVASALPLAYQLALFIAARALAVRWADRP